MSRDIESRSLAEMEAVEWPTPGPKVSPTIIRCYELRKKPISALTVSDWRVLIGQDIGLEVLMPKALAVVEKNPLVEAEHYRGDLLAAILRVSPQFFVKKPAIRSRVEKILDALPLALEKLDHIEFDTSVEALEDAMAAFRSNA